MANVSEIARPTDLWKQFTAERKQQAAEAFWRDPHAAAEQAEVIATVAHRIKFRPKSVVAMSVEKKARHLVSMPALSEMIAARLMVAFHLEHQRPMMGRFLDLLGIQHENGLIADDNLPAPAADALSSAAAQLATEFPSEEVRAYLTTLVWQDPETWGPLSESPQVRVAATV